MLNIQSLPIDILIYIISLLTNKLYITSTSKKFYKLREHSFWENLCKNNDYCFKSAIEFNKYYPDMSYTPFIDYTIINNFLNKRIVINDFMISNIKENCVILRFPLLSKFFNIPYKCPDLFCCFRHNQLFRVIGETYKSLIDNNIFKNGYKISFFCKLENYNEFKLIYSEKVQYNNIDKDININHFLDNSISIKSNNITNDIKLFTLYKNDIFYSACNKDIEKLKTTLTTIISKYIN